MFDVVVEVRVCSPNELKLSLTIDRTPLRTFVTPIHAHVTRDFLYLDEEAHGIALRNSVVDRSENDIAD